MYHLVPRLGQDTRDVKQYHKATFSTVGDGVINMGKTGLNHGVRDLIWNNYYEPRNLDTKL